MYKNLKHHFAPIDIVMIKLTEPNLLVIHCHSCLLILPYKRQIIFGIIQLIFSLINISKNQMSLLLIFNLLLNMKH